jgi:hypothetical protein
MMKNISTQLKLTEQEVLSLAVQSVRMTGGLEYFWNRLRTLHVISPGYVTIKELVVSHSDEIFRKGRGTTLADTDKTPYDSDTWMSREVEGDELAGFRAIDNIPLKTEIPNYGAIIQGKNDHPVRVFLLEYQYVVRDTFTIQPLFKVVAEFGLRRQGQTRGGLRGLAPRQLFIVGRDRHTYEPFALAIPNGLVKQTIDTCLRWTMNVHKGDEIVEV